MIRVGTLLGFIITIALFTSCSSINLSSREKQGDILITQSNFEQLEGTYSSVEYIRDSTRKEPTKTLFLVVKIIDENSLSIWKKQGDSIINTETVRGFIRKGYFFAHTKHDVDFLAGPLLWSLTDHQKCIGLSKNNNLLVLTNSSSVSFLLIAPMMAAGGAQGKEEWFRIPE